MQISYYRFFLIFILLFIVSCIKSQSVTSITDKESDKGWDFRDTILYFIVTDRFYDGDPSNNINVDKTQKGYFHGGDFQGIIDKIDYLVDLGINAIWITPIVANIEFPVTGAGFKDWAYHGYWGEDFEKVSPHWGSEEKLVEMIEKLHKKGIKVIIDIVINHPGYDSSWAYKDEWVRSTNLGTCKESDENLLTMCIAGLPDFKTEKPQVAEYLMNVYINWIKRTNCDGFRIDTAKHIEHSLLKEFRKRVKEINKNFFLLGEVYGGAAQDNYLLEWLSGDEMDACLDFGFSGSVLGYLTGRMRTKAFDRYLIQRDHFPPPFVTAQYLDSHDEEGFLYRAGGDKNILKLAASLQMTVLGIPVIYYGDEVGRIGGKWPENRSDMIWGDKQDKSIYEHYKKLISIRKKHKALSRGKHKGIILEDNVYAFLRFDDETKDKVIVVLNRSDKETFIKIPLSSELENIKKLKNEMNDKIYYEYEGTIPINIGPYETAILSPFLETLK